MKGLDPLTRQCTYSTPCGWCTKWDKKCDKKIGCEKQKQSYDFSADVNKACISESDHEWECCGISSIGWDYICKKCYTHKHIPYETTTLETHFTNSIKGDQQ